jgi:hypothetical protein
VPDLALLFELGQGCPAFLDVFLRLGPVDLVQIDDVDLEPSQAGVYFLPDRGLF